MNVISPRNPIGLLVCVLFALAVPSVMLGHTSPVPAPGRAPVVQSTANSTAAMTAVAGTAASAGFTGYGLTVAVAVGRAESGGRADAVGIVGDGSRDRGIWQINDRWHPEVSDACAFDPGCSALAVYRISRGGADWSSWVTYNSGAYLAYMPADERSGP